MSATTTAQTSASTDIDFCHKGSAQITLSTESEQFSQERLESILETVNEALGMELHVISHDCPRSPRRKRKIDPHELTLTVSNVVFTATIELTIGEYDIPPLNVYAVVEQLLYGELLIRHQAVDVENTTGVPVDYRKTRMIRELQEMTDGFASLTSILGFGLGGVSAIRI